ncbi:MAG: arylsulfatase [Rhodoplanes sp.]|nr:aspartate/glutamate racemase family protein [Rhodoplanes sp.]NVO15315.1 arylsulfatase [Rhodoplanes sp.]
MTKRIVLIHAVMVAMQPINDAFHRLWPDAECVNILDDSLSTDRGKAAEIAPSLFQRFESLSAYAHSIGADGVLFTCSAFGPAIEAVARSAIFPVLKPNEAMYEAALAHGSRIGMVATFAPAVAPMEQEFHELAAQRGSNATIKTICAPAAMDALNRGEPAVHNAIVAEAACRLDGVDVVMLAQFSTSRAEEEVARAIKAPILTSPGSAVRKLKTLLGG